MKYSEYLDERDNITRPRKKAEKSKVKKANHKHDYMITQTQNSPGIVGMSYVTSTCQFCDKTISGWQ